MTTMEQKNTGVVEAFIQAFWNSNDLSAADTFMTDDYRELSYQSKEGLKQFAAKILEAFPDKQYTVEEIIAEDEKVLVRMTVRGTHQGVFFGAAPTGRTMNVTLYRQYRLRDGKIAEHRGWIDMVTMWSQIQALT
ncbi:steroid delta-isomerase-like uncharacterized protein [Paenibacillus favisporus]|uniref:Steroid delta-isomerase-like uncharacterized protein n=1 Tax=Paenibacillus favisporus TaxID=221028 RepID=A0ABV2F7S7_9BACL